MLRYCAVLACILLCGNSMALNCPDLAPFIPTRPLYVIAGQSNAAGVASVDDYTSGAKNLVQASTHYPRVKVYGIYGYHAWLNGKDDGKKSRQHTIDWPAWAAWHSAQPGFGYKNGGTPEEIAKKFGPELAFASLLSKQPPYEHYIVKLAVADTPLAAHTEKDNWSPSGRLYAQLLRMIENAYHSQKSVVRLRVAGLFFMQGESDALDSTAAANYKINLHRLISNFRNAVHSGGCADDAQIPVVIGRIQDNSVWTHRKQVRLAQQEVSKESASVGLINTDDFITEMTDALHYNEYGQFHLGVRLYFALFAQHPPDNFYFNIQKQSTKAAVMEQFYSQGIMKASVPQSPRIF